ncbi:zinc-dependent alcohol dehydrogenase [Paenibacillus ginsengarvi]|uniref:zinc-dependent alcohol dehydrogenase n=1 Tax=Paenibacillus ginsengarvi TaxID=400777 RepID=UPI001960C087|nr:zinc-binding alcohol dehydrogenase [Paenibacillus ginsengarvi]
MDYAIQFCGRRQVAIAEIERPARPDEGHVLGTTLYSLISPGTELMSGFMAEESEGTRRPGYASVFRVEHTAGESAGLAPGDLALCMGRHQSYQHVASSMTVKVPAGVAADLAVLTRLMNVSMTTLMTTSARPGELVFVMGAGPVGLLAALLFQRCGYKVAVCDPDERRLSLARKAGIVTVMTEVPPDGAQWREQAALVLECSGHEAAVLEGCRLVRKRGEVVLIGVPWQRRTELYAHELLSLVFHRYVVLRSGWEWEIPMQAAPFQPHSIMGNLRKGMAWLAEGWLNVDGLVRKVLPRDANAVYNQLAERQIAEPFVVFDWMA